MGKLYQRYKRNGRQVSDFEKAEYTEVEKTAEDIEDVAPRIGESNQLQLESVAKRDSSNLLDKTKADEHRSPSVKEHLLSHDSDINELEDPRFNVPGEFKEHLKSYVDQQNYESLAKQSSNNPQPNPPRQISQSVTNHNESELPFKENYEQEAEKLGFKNLPKNLAHSLMSWRKTGRPVVSASEWNNRINTCRSCSYWVENQASNHAKCTKCGCGSGKLLLSSSRCPLNPPKW